MTATIRPRTTIAAAPATTIAPRRTGVRAAALIMVVVAAGLLPTVADAYATSLAASALVLAVLAMSTQLLVGIAGLPSMGQVAYAGIGGYTAALLALDAGITNGPVQLAAATAAGAVAAALTAPLVLRTRGTAFLMATFAVQSLVAIGAAQWKTVTGADEGIHTPPVTLWPGIPPLTAVAAVYWYVLGATLLIAAAVAVVLRSRLALYLRGCADHEPRMAALGHPVTGYLTAGYTIAGALAGAGGALLVTVNGYLSPGDLGFDTASIVLLAAAIGADTMTGAVAGAVAVVTVRDLLGASTGGHSLALLGLLFLTVVYGRGPAATLVRRARTQLHRRTS